MRNLTYREFRSLVSEAAGPFGYLFENRQFTIDPLIYLAQFPEVSR